MPATVIVGLQWGDEGKGKTTDFLAEQTAVVVRYQGGDNAGHTVVVGDETREAPALPVGRALPAHHVGHRQRRRGQPGDADPRAGHADRPKGVDVSKVRVSRSAHVIMPYHVALDKGNETPPRGRQGRHDRAAASGPRTATAPGASASGWRTWSTSRCCASASPAPSSTRTCCSASMGADDVRGRAARRPGASRGASASAPHLDDTTWLVQDALRRGDHVLLEGAQGTLLDLDHGSYPFVTSLQPRRRRRVHRRRHRPAPGRRGHRRHEGLLDPGRVRAVPDRAVRRHRQGDRGARPGVRHGHRAAAPGRLVRHGAAALRGRRELEQRDRPQQARHPVRASRRSGCASPTRSTAAGSTTWPSSRLRALARRARSTRTSRAGRSRSTTSARSPTCPRPPAAT